MNRFKKWVLKLIISKEVMYGKQHVKNIENLYSMIHDACIKEFKEDDAVTIHMFLVERWRRSLWRRNNENKD